VSILAQSAPGAVSPELQTFHPQPRRLHQPLVTPLLESEVSPPQSPELSNLEKVQLAESAPSAGGIDLSSNLGHEAKSIAREDGTDRRGEPYASTPSPEREGFGSASADWMESHMESPNPAVAHRSVQNTPEPTHYYSASIGMGQPISTPSPSATPADGSCNGQPPYLGLPPRFPHTHLASTNGMHVHGGVLVPTQLSTDFSAPGTVLPPPLPTPQSTVLPSSPDTMAHVSTQPVGFSAQFRLPLDTASAGMLAQASKAHVQGQMHGHLAGNVHGPMQGHLQGQLRAMQAANPQDAHHMPHGYNQAYQATAAMGPTGWRMPSCPMPVGFAPPHCMDLSMPSIFSTQAGQGQVTGELGPPLLPAPAATPDAGGNPGCVAALPPQTKGPRPPSAAATTATAESTAGSPPSEAGEMRGQVAQLSKTQAGSKYLQRQLLKGHASIVDIILREVEQDVAQLMCDAYGNYLCSVAFQACSVQKRKRMLEKLAPRVAVIACDKRGTHALQALIGLLSTAEEQELLMSAMKDHVIELCMDPNGTHVVQRLLYCFLPPCTDWIYYPVVSKLVEVAHHPYGLCVLKKCISQARAPGKHQELLLSQLSLHALDLVQSPYGNYAIQHALEEWGGVCCTPIFRSLEGRMMQLSIQKFSSNVVEKLFCSAPPEFRARFIAELIESERMSVLVNSNYGHYVVKRALQIAEPQQVRLLLEAIRGNIGQLPNRRLRAKWEKVMSAGSERLGDRCPPLQSPADRREQSSALA